MNGIKDEINLDINQIDEGESVLFLKCICEMMENVERKISFTKDFDELRQMKGHKKVIKKVLKQYLSIN